jgi:cytochrome c-type biogenesis protein CcmH/NrfG
MDEPDTQAQLRSVIIIPPQLLADARQLAYRLYNASLLDEAETLLHRLIAADATDAWSIALLGTIRRNQKRFAEAMYAFEQAHALAPADANIRTLLEELAAHMGAAN